MAEIADAFLAALRAGVPQEQAGRQAAEANSDMLTAKLAEQILEKTDAAVADLRARQARITRRWGTALDTYYMVTQGAVELGALAAQPRPQARFDSVSKALILLQARACQTVERRVVPWQQCQVPTKRSSQHDPAAAVSYRSGTMPL